MIPPPILWKRLPHDAFQAYLSTAWLPDLIRETAEQIPIESDHVINLQEVITLEGADRYLKDYCHPNNEGYQLIAEKLFNVLIKRNGK